MPVKRAFCTTCQRQVDVPEVDSLTCPACSSPLIETVELARPADVLRAPSDLFIG